MAVQKSRVTSFKRKLKQKKIISILLNQNNTFISKKKNLNKKYIIKYKNLLKLK